MILDADSSIVLSHFIPPEYLIDVLKTREITLIRQDRQSKDLADGKLPLACVSEPFVGELETTLGIPRTFLVSQAEAINRSRDQRFIHCWTYGPSAKVRESYSEGGRRCELRVSEKALKRMLGYEELAGCEFPPKHRKFPEIAGTHGTVQLIPVTYSDGSRAVPVVPSFGATAHKDISLADEAEARVEALVYPESTVGANDWKLRWGLRGFDDWYVVIGPKVSPAHAAEIRYLSGERGIVCQG